MSLRKPSPTITALILLLQVAFAACGSGIALCQEGDGQVTVEWSGADCCGDVAVSVEPAAADCCSDSTGALERSREDCWGALTDTLQPAPTLLTSGLDSCGSCEDGALELRQRADTPGSAQLLPLNALTVFSEPSWPTPSPHFALDAQLRSGTGLDLLRTIVIRC